jgi:hypothetical protein
MSRFSWKLAQYRPRAPVRAPVDSRRPSRRGQPGSLEPVRLTMFWDLMRAQFGDAYADSVAKDYVLAGLGGRTVNKALADGEDAKTVWRAVCDTFNVPEAQR